MQPKHSAPAVVSICLGLAALLALFASPASAQSFHKEFPNGMVNALDVSGHGNGDLGDRLNSAMSLHHGGVILVPDGTYSFSTTIEPPPNIGAGLAIDCGSTNTVLQYTGSGDAIYIHHHQSIGTNLVFRNCTLIATKESGPSANGVHVRASLGVAFYDCVIKNFKGYGVFNEGAIGALFSNVTAVSNGINLVDAADEPSQMSSNANRWIGGSLQYPGTINYWEAPSATLRNQLNVIETIFEMATPKPQAIIEACDSCTIRNSYIEYGGVSGTSFDAIVIGNAPHSGYGSQTSQFPKHFRLENNLTLFPPQSRSYAVLNVVGLTFNDLDEQGQPDCFINFAPQPTLAIRDVAVVAGLYNWGVQQYVNSRPTYFTQGH